MFGNLSVKNKTMFFITSLLLVFSIILFITIYINQKNKLTELERDYYFSLQESYEKILTKQRLFYENRIKANISSKGVQEAFANQDRQKLYDISKGRWVTLSSENSFLKIMHFHNPDGTSFLRMHQPKKFGDKVSESRAMIDQVHRTQKPLFGFENGIYHLSFRIVEPIFYKNKYIGALEFGSQPAQLLEEMEYFNDIQGALFIKDSIINQDIKKDQYAINGYTLQYSTLLDNNLVYKLPKNYQFPNHKAYNIDNKKYLVYSLGLKDYENNTIAYMVFFKDVSFIDATFNTSLKQFGFLIIGLMGLLFLAVHIGFNKILYTLEIKTNELSKNQNFMNSVLENIAHAVIATDKNGVITLFNKKAELMLGYKKEDMIGKHTPACFHKKSEVEQRAQEFSKEFNKNIQPGFDVFIAKTEAGLENDDEWTYIDSNKREFTVSLHITSLKNNEEEVSGYLGIAEDITFKKILEENVQKQKDELEAIFHTTKEGIAILDMETNFLFFNDAYLEMTGFTKDELLEKSCAGLTAFEDIEKTQKIIGEVLTNGHIDNYEKTCIVKNGKRIIVGMSIALMPDKKRLLISAKDITESKLKEKKIKEYIKLVDKNIITSTTDLEGNITYVSEAFCKISGFSKEELLGQNHRIVKHPDMPEGIYINIWNAMKNDETWMGEIKNRKKDGGYYWVQASISPIFDPNGKKIGYTAIRQDITDKKLIEEISITDGLTGIYNRRHFNEIFPKVINSAKRNNDLVSFLIMDIDHFKQYNDTYGHQMGDEVLIKVASAVKNSLHRADDYCFRLGGEEFGVIFKADSKEKALEFANRIRENIEKLEIQHEKNSASKFVTASMGLICKNAEVIIDADQLYKESDALFYKAKESGRNRVCI